MGMYLNPGNSGFSEIVSSTYVDKTGLIALMNNAIGTKENLVCVSRPRRFGKSFAAQMLCAYYDAGCDSELLFSELEIAKDPSFQKHINKYDVIYLDMTNILGKCSAETMISFVEENVTAELRAAYPDIKEGSSFDQTLVNAVMHSGRKIIAIIDEWDAPIRECRQVERAYLHFLRMLFKSSGTTSRIFAAAYMTGILPIKKDGSQSAISDFDEYTMLHPYAFGSYVGFTEEEVEKLCKEHDVSFTMMKHWYDGYRFKNVGSVYNPNSVMKALRFGEFHSYWTQTSAADSLMEYISKDYTGLVKMVAELIGGINVQVETLGFANDLTTFRSKDDVLTLLVHLGYLAYDADRKTVRIPNEEIRMEFSRAIRHVEHVETIKRLQESDRLFMDTLQGNEEAVAAQIERVHAEETSPLHYNKEDSLRSVIKLAYYTYRDHYLQWEELPAGEGFADIVYLPKQNSDWPALVVELKWNQSADGAIAQILDKKYPDALKDFGSDILLVGVNYDRNAPAGSRKHTCRIIRV